MAGGESETPELLLALLGGSQRETTKAALRCRTGCSSGAAAGGGGQTSKISSSAGCGVAFEGWVTSWYAGLHLFRAALLS